MGIQNQMCEAAMEQMGLTKTRILMAVAAIGFVILLLFLFIFVGMAALVGDGGTGSMGSIVNSMATGGGSGAAGGGGGGGDDDPEEAAANAAGAFGSDQVSHHGTLTLRKGDHVMQY